MSSSFILAEARGRVEALQASLSREDGEPARLIETHISWVLLGRSLAYKFKKPLALPFLDATTLAARRKFCDEELRLNRRLAPTLYLDVVDVTANAQGARFGGSGPAVDAAVRMRRFPDGALWREMVATNRLAPRHIDAMARTLADFHRDAAVAPAHSPFGTAESHRQVVQGVDVTVGQPALRGWLDDQLRQLAPLWAQRQRAGRVRECHGDLHLGNLLQLSDRATAFDGIEFDPALRWIDVIDDIAFLAMDLWAHDRRALALRFINAYLAATGDHDGVPLLRFSMVCRALVRAQVSALADRQGVQAAEHHGAPAYLELACALSVGGNARLAITHGLPGSGKSFVAQGVLEAAGALCVRSDVERKRLFGLDALAKSSDQVPGGIYDAATTARTYARLQEVAAIGLGAGWPVVVDAAFLRQSERAGFAALAATLKRPFSILECSAPPQVLRERIARRQAGGQDASEADAGVLARLAEVDEPLLASEHAHMILADADAAARPEALAAQWLAAAAPSWPPRTARLESILSPMADILLTFNPGSSSIKLGIFRIESGVPHAMVRAAIDLRREPLALEVVDADGGASSRVPLASPATDDLHGVIDETLAWITHRFAGDRLVGVAHRVVHGGDRFGGAAVVDADTLEAIEAMVPLAPLHQPQSLRMIHAIRRLRPDLPQSASFDTAFHRSQSDLVRRFALPRRLFDEGVKRYGFHGLSYKFIAGRLSLRHPAEAAGDVVVAHLGSGASVCGMTGGASRDTSMSFSTLDGVPMATRCGALDPGVLLHLQKVRGMSVDELEDLLYHCSGLQGVSGISADSRELAASAAPEADEALALFALRVAREIAATATTLGGLDALVFTAGIGEHQAPVRADICRHLAWLGVQLDDASNAAHRERIDAGTSRVAVMVMHTDEEQVIAEEACPVLFDSAR